jgi:hypothetical protein
MSNSLDQRYFRWYADDHSLGVGENPLAAENANPSVVVGTRYRLRIEVSAAGQNQAIAARLEFREGSDSWTALGAAGSTNVFHADSTYFSDGDATTDSLLTAYGSYSAGQAKDAGATSSSVTLNSGYYREWEWNIRFAAAAAGKTYQFRITNNGAALTTYNSTPQVQVSSSAAVVFRRNLFCRSGGRGVVS